MPKITIKELRDLMWISAGNIFKNTEKQKS